MASKGQYPSDLTILPTDVMLRLRQVGSHEPSRWAYHPSKVNEIHPHLSFDLLGVQIEAAHAIGINTLDILCAQIEEVVQNDDADGIFPDIVGVRDCLCHTCLAALVAGGKDPLNPADVRALGKSVYAEYARRTNEAAHKHRPGLPIFHNTHLPHGRRDLARFNTHRELESLPTGGVLFLPDTVRVSDSLQSKLRAFTAGAVSGAGADGQEGGDGSSLVQQPDDAGIRDLQDTGRRTHVGVPADQERTGKTIAVEAVLENTLTGRQPPPAFCVRIDTA